MRQITVKLGK